MNQPLKLDPNEILRPYTRAEVERLRGTLRVEHTLARRGAERLRLSVSAGHATEQIDRAIEAVAACARRP